MSYVYLGLKPMRQRKVHNLTKPKEKTAPAANKAALVREALEQMKAGQTIPSDDVEAWIESWDTTAELPKPTPRKR